MATVDLLPVPSSSTTRIDSIQTQLPEGTSSFVLGQANKSYKHQFSNLYFARLTFLKKLVEKKAKEKWRGLSGSPPLVPRVLEVVKSELCFVVGTVYMDMSQKPNVLDDVGRDRYLPAPPPREKYLSPDDAIMLEDESGRLQLVGEALHRSIDEEASESGWGDLLVTGVIMAALGIETSSGEFEVKDVCFAGMPDMLYHSLTLDENMKMDGAENDDDWIAFISGLNIDENSKCDLRRQMFEEYLVGEGGNEGDTVSKISRLIIVGNSLAPVTELETKPPVADTGFKTKRFGQEPSDFSSAPTDSLGDFLYGVASGLPVHLLPGETDPSGSLLPQQPLPRALFGEVKNNEGFHCETNPVWLGFESKSQDPQGQYQRSLFVHSGQSLMDMYKYVPSPPTSRLDLACATLQWRHVAPTAPDTLWCYPYLTTDPFILHQTPDVLVFGCQPEFASRLVSSTDLGEQGDERKCRVVLVPNFEDSGTCVLVNMRNLDVKTIQFGVEGRLKNVDGS